MHQVLSMKRSQTSVKNHMTQSMRMRQQRQNKGQMNVSFYSVKRVSLRTVEKSAKSDFPKIDFSKSDFAKRKVISNMLKVSFSESLCLLITRP